MKKTALIGILILTFSIPAIPTFALGESGDTKDTGSGAVTAPATPGSGNSLQPGTNPGATQAGFVPLSAPTSPLTQAEIDAANNGNLPGFFNLLYNICIGVAVVLAVLQLMRAGITYMTAAGNIGSTEKARHLIQTSLLGLLLVLSPVIVFGVINPAILNFDLNLDALRVAPPGALPNTDTNLGLASIQQGQSIIPCENSINGRFNCDNAYAQCSATLGGADKNNVCVDSSGNITETSWLSLNDPFGGHSYACPSNTTRSIQCTPNIPESKPCGVGVSPTGSSPVGTDTCPAMQCPAGQQQYYVCADQEHNVFVKASEGGGKLWCPQPARNDGTYVLTTQCRSSI